MSIDPVQTLWKQNRLENKAQKYSLCSIMETYFIIYLPKNICLDKESNKLMQGVGRRMRTTCFYLNSLTIALGNTCTSTMPFFHLWCTKIQLHVLQPSDRPFDCDKKIKKKSPSPKCLTALISKFLSNSFHDNPLIMWQRGEWGGMFKAENQ